MASPSHYSFCSLMHWGGESVNKLLMKLNFGHCSTLFHFDLEMSCFQGWKLISASHSLLWFQTADSLIPKEPRDWDFQKCCWQAGIIVEDQNHKIYKVLQVIIHFAEGSIIECDFKKIWILSLVHWIFHLNSQTVMFLLRLHEMGPLLQSHVLARSDWSWPQDCSRCWPRTTLVISTLDSSPPINRCSLHFTIHNMNQHRKIRNSNLKGLKEDNFRWFFQRI